MPFPKSSSLISCSWDSLANESSRLWKRPVGTRKRPRVCCLAIDLWRVLKIYSEKHVFDGTPLYSSAYSVVKVLFSLFWCVWVGTKRRVFLKGKKEAKKCVRIIQLKIIVQKNIFSSLFTNQNIVRFDRISRIRTTQSYCIMWSSLSSSQKVRIFRFFRWRRASGGNWIFNCDPIQISIQIGGARNFPPCSKYAPRFYSRSLLCFVFVVFL